MRAIRTEPIIVLLRTGGGVLGESSNDAIDRQTIPPNAVFRFASDGGLVGASSAQAGESKTHATVDANHENRGYLPTTANNAPQPGTPCFSVFIAKFDDHTQGSGMEYRHHIHPASRRLHVLGGGDGLAHALRVVLAAFKHVGGSLLHRGVGRLPGDQHARDLQYRSRLPIHVAEVYECLGRAPDRDQHGWPRSSVGQRVHRASMADGEVRKHLPERLRIGSAVERGSSEVFQVLLSRATALVPRQTNASGDVPEKLSDQKTQKVARKKMQNQTEP